MWNTAQQQKEQTTETANNLNDSPKTYTKWKQPIPKGHILYY